MAANPHSVWRLIAVLTFAMFAPAPADWPCLPVGARIVDRYGQPQAPDRFDDVVGNVEVRFSNGRKEIWTHSLQCELPKVSKSGLVGWTYAGGRHSRGAWMNNVLCVARSRRDITHFDADGAFIDLWDFTDHDTCVIIRYRNIHGPSWIDKFRIDTGKFMTHSFGSGTVEETPDWARPYSEP
jgi:hypothetical protein